MPATKHLTKRQRECVDELLPIAERFGVRDFGVSSRVIVQDKLAFMDREERKEIEWGDPLIKKMYNRCGGICVRCGQAMPFIRGKLEVDHFDPRGDEFNAVGNLQIMHKGCNRSKGANTVMQEAKARGITVVELLRERERTRVDRP